MKFLRALAILALAALMLLIVIERCERNVQPEPRFAQVDFELGVLNEGR